MKIIEQFKRSFAIMKKDLSIYYLKGPVVISGLLIPFFLFISFSFGKGLALNVLIPSLLGMTLFFTVSSIGPVIAPWETRMRTLERLISAPITSGTIIFGDMTASFLFGLFITSIVFLLSVFLLGTGIINLTLIIGIILAAFCFSSFGLLISAPPTDNPSNIMMLSTLVKFTLVFISGIFIPISSMGGWKIISYISPLTYYTDLVRYSVNGGNYFSPSLDLLILLGSGALFFIIAVKWHEKSLTKRLG